MQIRIEQGEGQKYAPGSRATRGITVVVSDDTGNSVSGATVTFALPDTGPGGVFADGSRMEVVTTKADGRATVWGMRWNREVGSFDVRITVSNGGARAGTVCSQSLVASETAASSGGGRWRGKWIWIGIAAGAAGAGIAIAARGSGGSGSCSSNVLLPQNPCESTPSSLGVAVIGQPTINLGPR